MPFNATERTSLLKVKGIGPTVIKRLEDIGITTLDQLSRASTIDVVTLDHSIFATVKGETVEYSLIAQQMDEESFPEGKALTPLLFQSRATRARGPTASLGSWTSALLSLKPDGRLSLSAYWEH
jgi:hypothetical protein